MESASPKFRGYKYFMEPEKSAIWEVLRSGLALRSRLFFFFFEAIFGYKTSRNRNSCTHHRSLWEEPLSQVIPGLSLQRGDGRAAIPKPPSRSLRSLRKNPGTEGTHGGGVGLDRKSVV